MDEAREQSKRGREFYGKEEEEKAGESDTWHQFDVCLRFEEGYLKHH